METTKAQTLAEVRPLLKDQQVEYYRRLAQERAMEPEALPPAPDPS